MIAASATKHYSGDQKATQEKGDQGLHGKEISTKKYGQPDIITPRGRWRQQHKTELDSDNCFVAYVQRRETLQESG